MYVVILLEIRNFDNIFVSTTLPFVSKSL